MNRGRSTKKTHHIRSALTLIVVIGALIWLSTAFFAGTFRSFVSVTLTSDRAGLVMESGGKVKMRGVQVGRVAAIAGGKNPVSLSLQIFPDQVRYIPSNTEAEIKATTAFGAKYVELIYPDHPSPQHVTAGTVLHSRNVSTEVNTVFQDLVDLLHHIDPAKLNAVLTAFAEGVRGQGERIGEATADANEVLLALNPRMDNLQQDWHSLAGFSDAYDAAAPNILTTLRAVTTTSATITTHAKDLDRLLLNLIGFARSGINLIGPHKADLVGAVTTLEPTTSLLMKYNPEYTCLLLGSKFWLDNGGYDIIGGNGSAAVLDGTALFGSDSYKYPDNLPIVAAKGGPSGKPGCGSLPDVAKNYPVRQLVTDTGFGTGLDIRPNPGIGHPWWVNYLPVTRAVPEPPRFHGEGPPAIGPVPPPGAPPYGAPLYGPDGSPLWPGVPALPPPPATPPADLVPAGP
ncbi:MAG: phospholipid/cholesterol/gamma-HCH transport system substrate-binding protein [Mycobacterium sp.]|jgi:phospholipid/cholesterol/gamma-HCH transport system substrate-binding protein|nr:phospholipid/cholesterol/gamma-HCH transport system substrate-binding protein [Mycobacterium sp.]